MTSSSNWSATSTFTGPSLLAGTGSLLIVFSSLPPCAAAGNQARVTGTDTSTCCSGIKVTLALCFKMSTWASSRILELIDFQAVDLWQSVRLWLAMHTGLKSNGHRTNFAEEGVKATQLKLPPPIITALAS